MRPAILQLAEAERILAALRTPAPDDLPDLGGGVVSETGRIPTSREVILACGGDPDAPFEVGPFPPEMRERPPQPTRNEVLEEAAQAVFARLYPKNPESDWTQFAKDMAQAALTAAGTIRALKTTPTEQSSVLTTVDQPSERDVERLCRAWKALNDNMDEFGHVTDGEFIDAVDSAIAALTKGQQP